MEAFYCGSLVAAWSASSFGICYCQYPACALLPICKVQGLLFCQPLFYSTIFAFHIDAAPGHEGETTFSRCELNTLANSLPVVVQHGIVAPISRMFNPHYNLVTGNYDANVLMIALQSRGAKANWFDKRKGVSALELHEPDKGLIGIILNHSTVRYAGLWKGRHWSALRNIGGVWYDLDSDLAAPELLGNDDEVKQFLEQSLAGDAEAILVYRSNEDDTEPLQIKSADV